VPEVRTEDVQEAVRVLLFLFQDNPEPNLRSLYKGAIKRAFKVVGVSRGKTRKDDWRERIEFMFGLNPDNPRKVVNQELWDRAWKQFRVSAHFSDATHEALKNEL
jgi:hypothetical protein